ANMAAVLAARGGSLDDVLKCNVYLADIRTFQAMNDVFARHFPADPPARTTVEARLADPHWLVEIEAVAFLGED
ncbi:MAG: RidA family protein, partial [Pseudomonadota bacterium]